MEKSGANVSSYLENGIVFFVYTRLEGGRNAGVLFKHGHAMTTLAYIDTGQGGQQGQPDRTASPGHSLQYLRIQKQKNIMDEFQYK